MSFFTKLKAFVGTRLGGSQSAPAATERTDLYDIDAHVSKPWASPAAKPANTPEQNEQILQSEFQGLLADLQEHSLVAAVRDAGAEKLLDNLNAMSGDQAEAPAPNLGAKTPSPILSESDFNQRLTANLAKSPLMNRDLSHARGKTK